MRLFERWFNREAPKEKEGKRKAELNEKLVSLERERAALVRWMSAGEAVPADRERLETLDEEIESTKREMDVTSENRT